MSIQSEINRIKGNVTRSLAKIAAKGVTVPDGANSDNLEALIEAIQAGGGKFATGTFITTDDITSNIVITHNLGVKPKFIIVLSSHANAYTYSSPKLLSFFYLFAYSSKYYGFKYQSPDSSSASYTSELISGSAVGTSGGWYRCNVDETTMTLKQKAISSTYGIGASYEFFWLAYGE